MSAVNLLSEDNRFSSGYSFNKLKEKLAEEVQSKCSNVEGEDSSVSSGGSGGDPAVLAVGPARKPLTYTRDELMRLRSSPLVKLNLENAFAGCEALALVLKKRSESPNEEEKPVKGDAPTENHKGVYTRTGRSADPRERVRKESEPSGGGIVLSPQRRSFTSGCGAPGAAPPPAPAPQLARTRPESPTHGTQHQPHQNKTEQGGRRIGSGRIMVRDTPGNTWEEGEYRANEPYRPPRERDREHNNERRSNNNDRFDRRSYCRESYSSDIKRERDDRFIHEKMHREDNRRSGGRFSQRRLEKEDEPEWFSGGPTSQLETIELRGFDEPPKKNGNANKKETEKWNNGGSRSPAAEKWRETSSPVAQSNNDSNTSNDKDSGVDSKCEDVIQNNDQPEFNLDEFLKFDSIPDVLTNGSGETEGGSRFSRWFRRESPTNDAKHYEKLLHNMVDELDNNRSEASPAGGAAEAHVFAPISPAARAPPAPPRAAPPHAPHAPPHAPPPSSLFELLLRANTHDHRNDVNHQVGGGKVHSLEELEARLRPQHSHVPHHHTVPDHDLTAFKRLLAQVSGGHAVTAAAEHPPRHVQPPPQPQPMSLLQMLNKSMEQQQKAQQHQQQQQQQQQQQPPHIPQELLYKLLQVQQHQQQQQQQHQHAQVGGGEMGVMSPVDRELLQRPEAQAIVRGLKTGEITVQHLMQQLNNPGLQSRHREVLFTILRLQQQQRQMSESSLANVPSNHLVVPSHHQPLRLSPLPHQGVPSRIPSPRELAAHTQSIMQNALIKKKLEEQRENFRRRQEIQQPKQSTPISFTPTSVLRKMTAEKESDSPSPKQQQWTQPLKVPQGRPIVKGNQSGTAPTIGYANTPTDYQQQHYLNQQQQMLGGVRPFPHPPQRQQIPNTYNNMNNMTRNMSGGTSLHKLLIQSHQRSLNEAGMGGAGGAGAGGGGDNQLARWFSPELLARASAGKLPSVHVPNALSLEDLERHHHEPAAPAAPVHN